MREVFFQHLKNHAKTNEFYFVTADVGFKFKDELVALLGPRFLNVGVAERNMIAVAAGLASQGHEVYCYSIGPFMSTEAFSFIRNDVVYHQTNLTMINGGAGLQYGQQGFSHHVYEDLNLLGPYPGVHLFQPSSSAQLPALFEELKQIKGPKYIRLGWRFDQVNHPHKNFIYELNPGQDVTLITSGLIQQCIAPALEQLQENSEKSIQVLVADKINEGVVQALKKQVSTQKIILIEESLFPGPLFSRIYNKMVGEYAIRSVHLDLEFHRVGNRNEMYDQMGFPLEKIKEAIESFKG